MTNPCNNCDCNAETPDDPCPLGESTWDVELELELDSDDIDARMEADGYVWDDYHGWILEEDV